MKEMVSSLCETVLKEGERFQSSLPDTRSRKEAAGGMSKAAVQAMLAQAQAELELRWEQKQVRQCFLLPTLTGT